jgi:SNF2 family DNA or RNA helicase
MTNVRAELNPEDGQIWLESSWTQKEMIKSLPGAKWDSTKEKWRLPVSWSACLALRGTFGARLEIGEELSKWALRERETRIDPCLALRDQLDAPGDPLLFGWQRSGAEFIARGRQVLIGDEMGSGKTITAIRGLAKLHSEGENVFPILVVCPNSVKRSWAREFSKWWPGITCSVIGGSAAKRRKAFAEPAHVYIINWESLRSHSRLAPYGSIKLTRCQEHGGEHPGVSENKCQVHERELNKVSWGSIIADECHRGKDPHSQQTRALWAVGAKSRFRIAMSGTPIAKDVTDLWAILHFLSPEEWPTKTRWIDRFVHTMLNAFNGMVVLGLKAENQEEFYATLNPRFRRMPEDVILSHLPPFLWERRDCEMSAKQAKAYKQLKEEMVAELEDGYLTVPSPLVATTRLLQLASSYADIKMIETTDEFGRPTAKQKVTLIDPSCKIDAFMDDIKDFGDQQVAVMAVSRQLIELLSARLTKNKIPHGLITGAISEEDRQQYMDDFQAGKLQFILFTAAAGGTGVTLTAARYLCRLQRPYSLVDDRQALKRVRRIGSERHPNIIVIDYVTEHTVESKVVEALDKKGVNFEEVVRDRDALYRLLTEEDE